MTTPLLVYGAGGLAREIGWLIECCRRAAAPERAPWELVGFISDLPQERGTRVHGLPVLGFDEARDLAGTVQALVGVGDPAARARLAARLAEADFTFATLMHPSVEWSETNTCGPGTIVQAASWPTVDVHIGAHVLVNGDLTIGHDARVGDCSVLCPGVHVSGWVWIGRRVFVGTGAVIGNGRPDRPLVIGDDAVIGAAACVLHDVAPGVRVAGVPAQALPSGGGVDAGP